MGFVAETNVYARFRQPVSGQVSDNAEDFKQGAKAGEASECREGTGAPCLKFRCAKAAAHRLKVCVLNLPQVAENVAVNGNGLSECDRHQPLPR